MNGKLTITSLPPVILSLTSDIASNIVISWTAIPNQVYRLLYSDNLSHSASADLSPDIMAVGTILTVTNLSLTATQRFYRVSLLP